jgi:hypothetical protein
MLISPQTSTLKSVEAVVPTIRGSVEVDIQSSSEKYVMRVKIPANAVAEVDLPMLQEAEELLVDGEIVPLIITENHRIECGEMGSGEHTFEVRWK